MKKWSSKSWLSWVSSKKRWIELSNGTDQTKLIYRLSRGQQSFEPYTDEERSVWRFWGSNPTRVWPWPTRILNWGGPAAMRWALTGAACPRGRGGRGR